MKNKTYKFIADIKNVYSLFIIFKCLVKSCSVSEMCCWTCSYLSLIRWDIANIYWIAQSVRETQFKESMAYLSYSGGISGKGDLTVAASSFNQYE